MSRDLLLIASALLLWGFGEGMFVYLQPLYLQQLGASPVDIGALLGVMGVSMSIAHIPAGYLADRFGRRPLIWLSWILGLLAVWIMALAPNLSVFVAGMLVYGVTMFVMSPMNSYITTARGRWSVARALTTTMIFYNFGAVSGPWLGGWIGSVYGLRRVYWVAACVLIISALVVLWIRPQPVAARHTQRAAFKLSFSRDYFRYLGIFFLVMFAVYLPQPLSPNYLQNVHGLSLAQIGQLGSLASAAIVLMGLASNLVSPRAAFLLAQFCLAGFALLLWQGGSFFWFALAYCLLGGYRVVRAMGMAQTRSLVEEHHMGLAYGLTETVGAAALILAPPLAGVLFAYAPAIVYPISLALILCAVGLSAWFVLRCPQLHPAAPPLASQPGAAELSPNSD